MILRKDCVLWPHKGRSSSTNSISCETSSIKQRSASLKRKNTYNPWKKSWNNSQPIRLQAVNPSIKNKSRKSITNKCMELTHPTLWSLLRVEQRTKAQRWASLSRARYVKRYQIWLIKDRKGRRPTFYPLLKDFSAELIWCSIPNLTCTSYPIIIYITPSVKFYLLYF